MPLKLIFLFICWRRLIIIEGFNSFFLWANFYLNYNSLYSTQNVLPQTEGEGERDGGEREEREREGGEREDD